jgi:hypothetical protein
VHPRALRGARGNTRIAHATRLARGAAYRTRGQVTVRAIRSAARRVRAIRVREPLSLTGWQRARPICQHAPPRARATRERA